MTAPATLTEQYTEYVAWASEVGTTVAPFAEWFQQRDHEPDEPAEQPCGCAGEPHCCPPDDCRCDGFQECVCGLTGAHCAGVDDADLIPYCCGKPMVPYLGPAGWESWFASVFGDWITCAEECGKPVQHI